MFPITLRNLQFSSHPVRSGHEDRVPEPRRLQVEQSPEPANDGVGPDALRRFNDGLDESDEFVSGVDGHSRGGVGESSDGGGSWVLEERTVE